jgi:hypothetical protein
VRLPVDQAESTTLQSLRLPPFCPARVHVALVLRISELARFERENVTVPCGSLSSAESVTRAVHVSVEPTVMDEQLRNVKLVAAAAAGLAMTGMSVAEVATVARTAASALRNRPRRLVW